MASTRGERAALMVRWVRLLPARRLGLERSRGWTLMCCWIHLRWGGVVAARWWSISGGGGGGSSRRETQWGWMKNSARAGAKARPCFSRRLPLDRRASPTDPLHDETWGRAGMFRGNGDL